MEIKNYFLFVGIIFSIIALAHLLRAILRVNVNVANYSVPVWMSYVAFLFLGILAVLSFKKLKTI